jgi:hypothetical protein
MPLTKEQQDNLRDMLYQYDLDQTYTMERGSKLKARMPFNKEYVLVMPHALVDPTVNPMKFIGEANPLHVQLFDVTTPTLGASVDYLSADLAGGGLGLDVGATIRVLNKTSGYSEVVRTITWIKQAACTTVAATEVVAAVAGKKHRILGGVVLTDAGMLAAGNEIINILDVAANIGLNFQRYLPIAAGIIPQTPIPIDLKPNGWLCAAANTAINVTLGTAITAGAISVTLWGCDE